MYEMPISNVPSHGANEKTRMLELGQEVGEVESVGPNDQLSYESKLLTEDEAVLEVWLDEGKIVNELDEDGEIVEVHG